MDRVTEYFGSLIRETDGLQTQQNVLKALGWEADMFLGTNTVVDKFTLVPTTPASLSVILTPGQIYQLAPLEATIWSSLPADTGHSVVKQGIMQDQDILGITPPTQIGYSQVYLIEVQYADLDTSPILLPYYNAQNPSIPFSGPANSGQSQNTERLGIASVQVKAGTAAPTGTQQPPAIDPGWVGLFTVTVAQGQATITAGNIEQLPSAPFLDPGAKLPALPGTVQNSKWNYAHDSGSQSNLVINLSPAPFTYQEGLHIWVKAANLPNGPAVINVNGLGNRNIVHPDGSNINPNEWAVGSILDLFFDGTKFQLLSVTAPPTSSQPSYLSISYIIDTVVTKIVHGPGADFVDLKAAFEWVAQYTITPNGQVIFQCASGQFTYSSMLFCDHPNLDRIIILGAHILQAPPLVDSGYTLSGYTSAQRTSDTTANLSLLRQCFATELRFTGGTGMVVVGKMLNALDSILFTGDGTVGTGTYPNALGVAFACSGNVYAYNSVYNVGIACVGFGGHGFSVLQGNTVTLNTPLILCGNNDHGCSIANQSSLVTNSVILTLSNGTNGMDVSGNGYTVSNGNMIAECNANHGLNVQQSRAVFTASGNKAQRNGGWGVSGSGNAHIICNKAFSGNALGPIQALDMSEIVATGSTGLSGASPATGTVGNNQSYIATT